MQNLLLQLIISLDIFSSFLSHHYHYETESREKMVEWKRNKKPNSLNASTET